MATTTRRTLKYMASSDLLPLLRQQSTSSKNSTTSKLAIIDVRDDDRYGGHIVNSFHAPSSTFDTNLLAYVEKFKDFDKVVFHCMLSQCRGPSCARAFAKECDERLGEEGPEVFVLDKGFSGFLSRHGKERELFEGLPKDISTLNGY